MSVVSVRLNLTVGYVLGADVVMLKSFNLLG